MDEDFLAILTVIAAILLMTNIFSGIAASKEIKELNEVISLQQSIIDSCKGGGG